MNNVYQFLLSMIIVLEMLSDKSWRARESGGIICCVYFSTERSSEHEILIYGEFSVSFCYILHQLLNCWQCITEC